jgi:hypothetical protein
MLKSASITFVLSDTTSSAVAVSVSTDTVVVAGYNIVSGETASRRIHGKATLSVNPWRDSVAEAPVYRHLRITAEPGRWVVSFDENPDIVIPPPDGSAPSQLVLISEGACHLESMGMVELTSRP